MAIKTIKKRENHKNRTYKATCCNCGSEFEACDKDLKLSVHRKAMQIMPTNQPEVIDCPECDDVELQFVLSPIPPGNE